LAGSAEKLYIPACVKTADKTLVALAAPDGRINGDTIAWSDPSHGFAGLYYCGRTLMSYTERIFDDLTADAPGCEIMHIRSADAHGHYPEEDVGFLLNLRIRDVGYLYFSDTGKNCYTHDYSLMS
jgi:hypothetical protein